MARAGGGRRRSRGAAEAMLSRMEGLLERALAKAEQAMEAAGEGAAEPSPASAKGFADVVSLIARTVEKISEMKRVMASEALAAGSGEPSAAERAALRSRIEEIIEARARERVAGLVAAGAVERDRERDRPPGGADDASEPAERDEGAENAAGTRFEGWLSWRP